MKKDVIFAEEAREQIREGAELLYKAVSSTLGPKGLNVVIEAYGEPVVTHDGVTVAKSIEVGKKYKNKPGVRVGVEMIKASSSKTNDKVGDGTTSSTILSYHLIEAGLQKEANGKNPMVLRRELDKASESVLVELEKLAEPIKTEKQAIEVATISSEDEVIGREVGKLYHKLGKNAMVTVEIDQSLSETEYIISEGYTVDRGIFSPILIEDSRTQTTTLENPAVFVTNNALVARDVVGLVRDAYDNGKDSMIIFATDFKQDLLDSIIGVAELIKVVLVKAPGFGEQRPLVINDLAKICGTRVFGQGFPEKVSDARVSDLGSVGKVVVSLDETVITGTHDVSEHVKDLEAQLAKEKVENDKQKLEKRIGQLNAKIGNIRVGGHTEMEAEERKYLIDDAVAATEAALKEGIVPGGGTTYIQLAKLLTDTSDGADILRDALHAPFKVLMTNSGERYGVKLEELKEYGKGFDVMGDGKLIDLRENGIIDPVMVIKQAIQNSVSVAGRVLTSGALVAIEMETKDEEA